MIDLQDKRVWLTGASLGIGRALAIELARRGAQLVLTSRGEQKLIELRTELDQMGARALVKAGDVTRRDRMRAIAEEVESECGRIDILIANAGTHKESDPTCFDAREYMSLMELNFGGVLNCIEAVLPSMLEQRAGHIVGVASLAGLRGMPTAAAYGASKSALINFLESIRFHLKEEGLSVTVVNPGFVKTPLTDKNEFHMPFLIEADRAATIICDGIARGRSEISFPIPFNWTIKFMRIIPYPIYEWIMTRVWQRTRKD